MKKVNLRFAIFIAIIIALIVIGQFFSVTPEQVDSFLQKVPIKWAGVIFVFLYVVGTFFIWYLKDPLKVVGAVIFGAYVSTLLIYIAEIINAVIFFNLSSILGKDFLEKRLPGKFKNLYEKVERLPLGWVFLLRVIPLVPYRVLDASFGLSKFSFRKYMLVVILASLPRIFILQFIAAAARGFSIERMVDYFLENPFVTWWFIGYFVFAAIIIVMLKKRLK